MKKIDNGTRDLLQDPPQHPEGQSKIQALGKVIHLDKRPWKREACKKITLDITPDDRSKENYHSSKAQQKFIRNFVVNTN